MHDTGRAVDLLKGWTYTVYIYIYIYIYIYVGVIWHYIDMVFCTTAMTLQAKIQPPVHLIRSTLGFQRTIQWHCQRLLLVNTLPVGIYLNSQFSYFLFSFTAPCVNTVSCLPVEVSVHIQSESSPNPPQWSTYHVSPSLITPREHSLTGAIDLSQLEAMPRKCSLAADDSFY